MQVQKWVDQQKRKSQEMEQVKLDDRDQGAEGSWKKVLNDAANLLSTFQAR